MYPPPKKKMVAQKH